MMSKSRPWKIFAVAISLSCLFFLTSFRNLLYPTGDRFYEYEIPRLELAAVLVCVPVFAALIALLLFLIDRVERRGIRIGLQLLFAVVAIVSFCALNAQVEQWLFPLLENTLNFELPLLIALVLLFVTIRQGFSFEKVFRNINALALFLLPFGLFLCVQTAMTLGFTDTDYLSPQAVENPVAESNEAKHRVLWIVFDELEMATLLSRPKEIQLPALERLMSESFVASQAYPPNQWTRESLHSLLTGRVVAATETISARDARYTFEKDSSQKLLTQTQNIFTDMSAVGARSGAVGWFIPYPRAFQRDLSYAYWSPYHISPCRSMGSCIAQVWGDALNELPVTNPFDPRPRGALRELDAARASEQQFERLDFLTQKSKELAARKDISVAFYHLPIPHAPFITERPEPTMRGYLQSLKAVDKMIAELRTTLESEGLWDQTSVIVTGDHWWRFKTEEDFGFLPPDRRREIVEDTRVPFIVKVGGSSRSSGYDRPFNTVLTRYLVQELVKGLITSPDEVAAWLDKSANEHPDLAKWRPKKEAPSIETMRRNRSEVDPVKGEIAGMH